VSDADTTGVDEAPWPGGQSTDEHYEPADTNGSGEPGSMDVEELLSTLEAVTAERDSHLADLQRITAEYANFRRQASKRQSDMVEYAASGLAEKLVPVLDACESAVTQGADDVVPIRGQLLEVLKREGLEVVDEAEEPFDPERHEAVLHEPADDVTHQVVAEVMRSGYVWRGRVLRPAMVRVRG
jgi:molecular chaperone GrpE